MTESSFSQTIMVALGGMEKSDAEDDPHRELRVETDNRIVVQASLKLG